MDFTSLIPTLKPLFQQYLLETIVLFSIGSWAGYRAFVFNYKRKIEDINAREQALQKESANTGPSTTPALQFPKVTIESERDLISRITSAKAKIRIFGLTRNHYATPQMRSLLIGRAKQIPISIYVMDPECISRVDRYRVEPWGNAFGDPEKYKLEIESVFVDMIDAVARGERDEGAGLSVFYYNYPCQFSIEQFDEDLRISIYGINKKGSDSPIWVQTPHGNRSIYDFFLDQLNWISGIAEKAESHPLIARGITVVPIEECIRSRDCNEAKSKRKTLSREQAVEFLANARVR